VRRLLLLIAGVAAGVAVAVFTGARAELRDAARHSEGAPVATGGPEDASDD
jgi:hypothetical protein